MTLRESGFLACCWMLLFILSFCFPVVWTMSTFKIHAQSRRSIIIMLMNLTTGPTLGVAVAMEISDTRGVSCLSVLISCYWTNSAALHTHKLDIWSFHSVMAGVNTHTHTHAHIHTHCFVQVCAAIHTGDLALTSIHCGQPNQTFIP